MPPTSSYSHHSQNTINCNKIAELFHGIGIDDVFTTMIFQYTYFCDGLVCLIKYVGIPNFGIYVTPEFLSEIPNASKIGTVDLGPLPQVIRGAVVAGWEDPEGLEDGFELFEKEDEEREARRRLPRLTQTFLSMRMTPLPNTAKVRPTRRTALIVCLIFCHSSSIHSITLRIQQICSGGSIK